MALLPNKTPLQPSHRFRYAFCGGCVRKVRKEGTPAHKRFQEDVYRDIIRRALDETRGMYKRHPRNFDLWGDVFNGDFHLSARITTTRKDAASNMAAELVEKHQQLRENDPSTPTFFEFFREGTRLNFTLVHTFESL